MRAGPLSIFGVFACATVLGACEPKVETRQAPPPADPVAAADPAPPAEPLDAFVVMIDAERWGVLLDKAREAIRETRAVSATVDESEALRADRAVKSGAAELLVLRNDICAKGLLTGEDCEFADWPSWVIEPPSAATPLAVIRERSDWLGAAMSPFVALGCQSGREAFNDDMFCSVE